MICCHYICWGLFKSYRNGKALSLGDLAKPMPTLGLQDSLYLLHRHLDLLISLSCWSWNGFNCLARVQRFLIFWWFRLVFDYVFEVNLRAPELLLLQNCWWAMCNFRHPPTGGLMRINHSVMLALNAYKYIRFQIALSPRSCWVLPQLLRL
jgi:hypothetical protein